MAFISIYNYLTRGHHPIAKLEYLCTLPTSGDIAKRNCLLKQSFQCIIQILGFYKATLIYNSMTTGNMREFVKMGYHEL